MEFAMQTPAKTFGFCSKTAASVPQGKAIENGCFAHWGILPYFEKSIKW